MGRQERWAPPKCGKGQAAYRSQGRALAAALRLRQDFAQDVAPPASGGPPRGVYRCGCGAWHLTSGVGEGVVLVPGASVP